MPGDFDFNTDDLQPKPRRVRSDRDDDRDERRERDDRRSRRDRDERSRHDDDDRRRRDDDEPRSRVGRRERDDDNPFSNDSPPRREEKSDDVPEATPVNQAPAANANPFVMDDAPAPKPRRSRHDDDDDRDDRDDRRSRSRRSRDDDDRDDRPNYRDRTNKKSPLIIVAVILGGLIIVGGAVGGIVAITMSGKDTPKETAKDKDKNAVVVVNKGNPTSDKQGADKKNDPAPNATTPSKDVVDKVKRNTVYIRVLYNDKRTGGTGSGFVERKSKYIITNAHVVGALKPKDPGPAVIELIFNSGEEKEFAMYGELIALDREADLAVIHPLRNPEKNVTVPEGLTVTTKPNLAVFQPLFVFGFPFGESLGKEITATNTTVSSIRKSQLQLNGGIHPGNSGGPVVDIRGNVVGVVVAKIKESTIDFAIPSEIVTEFLMRENLD